MKKGRNSGVVEDIWMNTRVGLDEMDPAVQTDPDAPAGWDEVEENNILLNPDVVSMEDRG